jgi:Omp85 superfamily domain
LPPLAAQESPDPPPAGADPDAACPQGRISSVFVDNHSVFDLSDPDLNMRFSWAYRLANRLHPATREGVIRREILFDVGDCYDVEVLRDSERLLRSLDFIAAVDIFGVRQPDGSIHVLVDTRDEWSLQIEPEIGAGNRSGLTGLSVGEKNLLGTGTHVAAFYEHDREEQVYGLSFYTPQLLTSRWDATLDVGRTPVGQLIFESLAFPFVGEGGRWAFRQTVQRHDRYFEYLIPAEPEGLVRAWYPESRTSMDAGVAFRLGHDGYNRTLVGVALAGEWVSYPEGQDPVIADSPQRQVPPVDVVGRDTIESIRALFMLGQRNVYYLRGRRLDTVNGTEDVRLGVETEVALGPSIPGLTHRQDLSADFVLSVASELYDGGLTGGQLLLEARRDYRAADDGSEWTDVFGQLNLWSYLRTSPGSPAVLVAALNAAGGWHDVVPFQLTLGRDAGLRGYPEHVYPGARRVVATLEERVYLGWPLPDLFDLGGVAFLDVGKIWAGSAPFGVTSPVRMDAGVGLRAAFPPGSRQTLRIDFGVPLGDGGGFQNAVFSVGMGQIVGARSLRRDPQLSRSTRQTISPSVFVLPPRRR